MPNVPDSQTEEQREYGTLQATGKQDWSCFYFLPYPFLGGDASKRNATPIRRLLYRYGPRTLDRKCVIAFTTGWTVGGF